MDKKIVVVAPGAQGQNEGREATIHPGNTAADVLRAAGFDPSQYQLQRKQGDAVTSIAATDDLFAKVNEGEKLYVVSTKMAVGRA